MIRHPALALLLILAACKTPRTQDPSSVRDAGEALQTDQGGAAAGSCTTAYWNIMNNKDGPFPSKRAIIDHVNDTPGVHRRIVDVRKFLDVLYLADPDLRKLFDCDSGVSERLLTREDIDRYNQSRPRPDKREWLHRYGLPFTIHFHTLRVLNVFNDQRRYYQFVNKTAAGENIDPYPLVAWTLALHDAGKPVAAELGDTRRQHEFIPQLVGHVLGRMEFTPLQVRIGMALTGHDIVGMYMKTANLPVSWATGCLDATARKAGLTLREFWPMQRLLYLSDATSYAFVRQKFFAFISDDGRQGSFPKYDPTCVDCDFRDQPPAGGRLISMTGRLEALDKAIAGQENWPEPGPGVDCNLH